MGLKNVFARRSATQKVSWSASDQSEGGGALYLLIGSFEVPWSLMNFISDHGIGFYQFAHAGNLVEGAAASMAAALTAQHGAAEAQLLAKVAADTAALNEAAELLAAANSRVEQLAKSIIDLAKTGPETPAGRAMLALPAALREARHLA